MKRRNLAVAVQAGLCWITLAAGLSVPMAIADSPTTTPSTQPAAEAPADTKAAKPTISAEAQTELDAITAAYNKLTSFELAGTLDVLTDVDGQSHKDSSSFTSSFQSPVKFRHEMKDDVIAGCTGDKSYLYVPDRNMYIQSDAPKTRADTSKSTSHAYKAVQQQNPSLFMALSDNAGQSLVQDAIDVSRGKDEKIGEKAYTVLSIKTKSNDFVVLLDPATHYVRQIRIDLTKDLLAHGAPNVKTALETFNYTTVTPNGEVKPDQFAWTPPQDAKDAAAQQQALEDAANAIVNKPAIAFSLQQLDGTKVTLDSLKNQVFILDFWATWCGPCRASLPHLDELYQSKKADGLKVFAVNLKEDKAQVQDFVTRTKLGIPVLLDTEGQTADAYGIAPIPETVLIGKDGVVKKVIVGLDVSDDLQKAVEAEMKK